MRATSWQPLHHVPSSRATFAWSAGSFSTLPRSPARSFSPLPAGSPGAPRYRSFSPAAQRLSTVPTVPPVVLPPRAPTPRLRRDSPTPTLKQAPAPIPLAPPSATITQGMPRVVSLARSQLAAPVTFAASSWQSARPSAATILSAPASLMAPILEPTASSRGARWESARTASSPSSSARCLGSVREARPATMAAPGGLVADEPVARPRIVSVRFGPAVRVDGLARPAGSSLSLSPMRSMVWSPSRSRSPSQRPAPAWAHSSFSAQQLQQQPQSWHQTVTGPRIPQSAASCATCSAVSEPDQERAPNFSKTSPRGKLTLGAAICTDATTASVASAREPTSQQQPAAGRLEPNFQIGGDVGSFQPRLASASSPERTPMRASVYSPMRTASPARSLSPQLRQRVPTIHTVPSPLRLHQTSQHHQWHWWRHPQHLPLQTQQLWAHTRSPSPPHMGQGMKSGHKPTSNASLDAPTRLSTYDDGATIAMSPLPEALVVSESQPCAAATAAASRDDVIQSIAKRLQSYLDEAVGPMRDEGTCPDGTEQRDHVTDVLAALPPRPSEEKRGYEQIPRASDGSRYGQEVLWPPAQMPPAPASPFAEARLSETTGKDLLSPRSLSTSCTATSGMNASVTTENLARRGMQDAISEARAAQLAAQLPLGPAAFDAASSSAAPETWGGEEADSPMYKSGFIVEEKPSVTTAPRNTALVGASPFWMDLDPAMEQSRKTVAADSSYADLVKLLPHLKSARPSYFGRDSGNTNDHTCRLPLRPSSGRISMQGIGSIRHGSSAQEVGGPSRAQEFGASEEFLSEPGFGLSPRSVQEIKANAELQSLKERRLYSWQARRTG